MHEAVAEYTGLTRRSIRYYEDLELLTPSGRSTAGHRLYSDAHVALAGRSS